MKTYIVFSFIISLMTISFSQNNIQKQTSDTSSSSTAKIILSNVPGYNNESFTILGGYLTSFGFSSLLVNSKKNEAFHGIDLLFLYKKPKSIISYGIGYLKQGYVESLHTSGDSGSNIYQLEYIQIPLLFTNIQKYRILSNNIYFGPDIQILFNEKHTERGNLSSFNCCFCKEAFMPVVPGLNLMDGLEFRFTDHYSFMVIGRVRSDIFNSVKLSSQEILIKIHFSLNIGFRYNL